MKISIFGLGYVGAVTAACLAEHGHSVVGVDVHPQKVDTFNAGKAPIVEPELEELLAGAHARGLLKATMEVETAIRSTDLSIVCVGTPSALNGALDLTFVKQVAAQIAEVLRAGRGRSKHFVVFRSTMLPGSTAGMADQFLTDLMEQGKVEVFYYPEFLREGTAVKDFRHPSLAVVGTRDGSSPPAELSEFFGKEVRVVPWNAAEMVKYACNAWHATKIAFANEMGRLGKQLQLDASAVMEILCQDSKLNISSAYLRPGNPFGGSCLPKDVRAVTHRARVEGIQLPVLENLLHSNQQHLQSLLQVIASSNHHEVAILGLSFKPSTDDLRESAMVEVAQHLLGRGYQLRIYDPQLNLAALIGSNKRLIDTRMPHLATLLQNDLAAAVGQRGLVMISQKCAPFADLKKVITPAHHVLDVNGWPELRQLPARYEGFCW